MKLSPQTLSNKCAELEQRLQWPPGSVTWQSHQDPAGNPCGILLRTTQPANMAAITPHLHVTLPGAGMMIHRRTASGRDIHIPALSADLEP